VNTLWHISRDVQYRIAILLVSVVLSAGLSAQGNAQTNIAPKAPPQVDIAGTQVRNLHSAICNQEYVLYVNLPRGYDDTTKRFPVLFHLDAQYDFPLVQAIYGEQYYDGFVPGVVVVGITWGGKDPDYDTRRTFDLTPTDMNKGGKEGNAPNFLAFIKKELIPFVESTYRVRKDDRALVGSSFGGLFTLYAMFHETETFNRYILTSPSLGWDNNIVTAYDKSYAEKHKELHAKVFMAVGGYEDVPSFQKFADELKGMNYKGLELQTKVLDGMGHSGGKAEGYARGLQFVYEKPIVSVEPRVLDQYVGEYEVNPQFHVLVQREGNRLVGIAPGSPKLMLYAETEKDFYSKGQYLLLHFQKDEKGQVTGFQLEPYSGGMFVRKVK